MTKRIVALGWAGALMVFFMAAQAQSVKMNPKTDNLWFDGFWLDPLWSAREGRHLYQVIKSAKSDVLSTRLSVTKDSTGQETFWTDGASGDYFSMEAKTTDAPDFPWEACTSVTYPVYAYEPDAKMLSGKALIDLFSRTLCGNGATGGFRSYALFRKMRRFLLLP